MKLIYGTVVVFFTVALLIVFLPFVLLAFASAFMTGLKWALLIIVAAFVWALFDVTKRRSERRVTLAALKREMAPLEELARENGFTDYRNYSCAGSMMPEPQRSDMARILGFVNWEEYVSDYKARTQSGQWLPGLHPAVRFTYPQYPNKRKGYVWRPGDFRLNDVADSEKATPRAAKASGEDSIQAMTPDMPFR